MVGVVAGLGVRNGVFYEFGVFLGGGRGDCVGGGVGRWLGWVVAGRRRRRRSAEMVMKDERRGGFKKIKN